MVAQHNGCSARWLLSKMIAQHDVCDVVCNGLYDVVCDAVCGVVFGVVCGVVLCGGGCWYGGIIDFKLFWGFVNRQTNERTNGHLYFWSRCRD